MKILFVADSWNYADGLTKYHPLTSTKMLHLIAMLRDGKVKIPLSAFKGRTQHETKRLYGKTADKAEDGKEP